MNKKHLQAKIYVLKEVNKILIEKRDEFTRQIDKNETIVKKAEEFLKT